mmetsp:Transcript_14785/g.36179  ORF Transcript_14785/g.36179 Transcript_14785/m.36179 type:complete len:242 (-) Transcript_14785:60-785(-)
MYQTLEALPRRCVPDAAQAVEARGDNQRAVAVELHGGDGVRVGGQHAEALAALDVPDAHRLVEGAADNEVGLWVEGAVEDVARVPRQHLEALPLLDVPHPHRLVVGRRAHVVGVRGPRTVRDSVAVPDKFADVLPRHGVPDHHGLVGRRAREELAAVREFDARHRLLVPLERALQPVARALGGRGGLLLLVRRVRPALHLHVVSHGRGRSRGLPFCRRRRRCGGSRRRRRSLHLHPPALPP